MAIRAGAATAARIRTYHYNKLFLVTAVWYQKCTNLEFPSNAVTKTVDWVHAEGLKYQSIPTATVRDRVNVSVRVTGRAILTRAGRV